MDEKSKTQNSKDPKSEDLKDRKGIEFAKNFIIPIVMPIVIAIVGIWGSNIISDGQIRANKETAMAQLKANKLTEINKLILELHSDKPDANKKGAAIGLIPFGKKAIPSLVSSLDNETVYPEVIKALRHIGYSSVKYLYNFTEESYKYRNLKWTNFTIDALSDINIINQNAIKILWKILKDEQPGREIDEETKITKTKAFIALMKLGQHDDLIGQQLYDFKLNLTDIDIRKKGITDLSKMDFSYMPLNNVAFNNIKAEEINFEYSDLIKVTFRDSNFKDGDFNNTTIVKSDLSRSKFTGARFNKAKLDNVNFDSADLSGADFTDAFLDDMIFYNANLTGANFYNAKVDCTAIRAAKTPISEIKGLMCDKE
ncbi:hypothetical protein GMMP15_20017 [Candidatus Magnetomoraceae bacterium gMMP-15]